MHLSAFLNSLLSGEGYRCGVAIKDGKVQQAFFETNETLADFLLAADRSGWDAYHACATFRSSSRTAAAAVAAQALWLDIDAGANKPYAAIDDAELALLAFVDAVGLPDPTLVESGTGLHAYWFLSRPLAPAEWLQYAARLKVACATHGFHADPARTADIASILRPPETHNYKRDEKRPVALATDLVSYDATIFDVLPAAAAPRTPAKAPLAAALANVYGPTSPADADRIADNCPQVAAMRNTKGLVTEPIWKAVMGILAHCDEGEEIAHEWSVGDPRYSEAETQDKYDRSTQLSGPTTCAHFYSLNPAGCAGCPHFNKIATPVQLGRGTAPALPAATLAAPDVEPGLPPLPVGFCWGAHGALCMQEEGKKGELLWTTISRNTLYLNAIARGELRDDRHYYVLRHKLPLDGWVDVEIPAKELWSSQGMSSLAGKGVVIEDADCFKKYMRDAVHAQQCTRKLGMMYEQCGWKEGDTAFLVGARLYRATGVEDVAGTPEINYRGKMLTPREGGSLNGWQTAAERLFGIGREAQSFALLASFGATLIRFLSSDEGGAIVSLVSRGSGKGKSTALAGATSVWGEIHGLQLTNADTAVSKGLTFGVLGNLPAVFDELAAKEPEVIREFVQMFTNGRDKMRGTQDGEIKHTLATWQTILITASNASLVDAISAVGGSDAISYRVLEFNVSLPLDVPKAGDALKEQMHKNWGYAGDAFIRYLVNPDVLNWAKNHVRKMAQDLIAEHGFRPEHRFWVRTLACVATAGVIAQHLNLVAFPVGPILAWALEACKRRIAPIELGIINNKEGLSEALDILTSFMNERINETLVMPKAFQPNQNLLPRVKPQHKLTMRYDIDPGMLYISDRELRYYLVEREFSASSFFEPLEKEGIVVRRKVLRTLGAGTDFASGPTPCVEISLAHPTMGSMPKIAPFKVYTGGKEGAQ